MGRQAVRKEIHTDDIKIEQKPIISDKREDYDGDIVLTEKMPSQELADELAFNEEPVWIRLEPSSDKNAATAHPIWNNGKGCEVLVNGKWLELTWLKVGIVYPIKRKYLATLVGAKLDTVNTKVLDETSERPNNVVERFTSAVVSFSVIEDKNPRGAEWLTNLRRRNGF